MAAGLELKLFVQRWPDLANVEGARTLESGAVLIRTTEDPWVEVLPDQGRFDAPWMQPILAVLGTDPFTEPYGWVKDGRAVPTEEDHLAAAPRHTPRPTIQELKLAEGRKRGQDRYPTTRLRRLKLDDERAMPVPLGAGALEFSTDLDVDVFEAFWKLLRRELKGDLQGTYGTVLAQEIATSPLQHEEETLVNTRHGSVLIHWFIGDYDVVGIYIYGPKPVNDWCWKHFEA